MSISGPGNGSKLPRLAAARAAAGLSQRWLASIINKSAPDTSRLENHKVGASAYTLALLCDRLGCSEADLTSPPPPDPCAFRQPTYCKVFDEPEETAREAAS